ncbi:MAG: MurR/RpiR family transcriptional regulator [Ruminococcaceae bacterium]|nr:MurR/RpiR family transcriptional regulator [Oscillospiraceae bacterium]
MKDDLLQRISEMMPEFSKGQKLIAKYILEHYEKAAYMTALKLGNTVNVSESTVVRFANKLDFEGYPQLQRSLQSHIKNRLTSIQRMDVTRSRIGTLNPVEGVLNQDIDKIRRTMDSVSHEAFDKAVDIICSAKNIYIQGAMSSGILANFMHYYLRLIFDNVSHIGAVGTNELYQQMVHIGKGDVLIALSFPRYATSTIEACKFAYDSGAHIIAITDSESSPLVQYADCPLYAYSDMVSFVDSIVAPMSLINALIVAVSDRNRESVELNFNKLERLWERNEVYKKDV